MTMQGFTAGQSLQAARGHYRSTRPSALRPDAVIPSIPACANCDWILDNCEKNGWRPRALCAACATGNCYEEPPMPDPFPDPFPPFPRF
ncbi:MAG: hypothetical protein L0Y50_08365 [Beijerinckiaceae bacterium]|nr:hypothetical protein [Beijerinckiaceae bacterium]MCI0736267.1 hypothetical protein [Beijerinckiaceae bacterium]